MEPRRKVGKFTQDDIIVKIRYIQSQYILNEMNCINSKLSKLLEQLGNSNLDNATDKSKIDELARRVEMLASIAGVSNNQRNCHGDYVDVVNYLLHGVDAAIDSESVRCLLDSLDPIASLLNKLKENHSVSAEIENLKEKLAEESASMFASCEEKEKLLDDLDTCYALSDLFKP